MNDGTIPESHIEWIVTHELSYDNPQTTEQRSNNNTENSDSTSSCNNVCFYCDRANNDNSVLRCSKCRVATYCSKECQINDWKQKPTGHKGSCSSYERIGPNMDFQRSNDSNQNTTTTTSSTRKADARNDIINRIRFYIFPYAVYKQSELGPGFLFIQSDNTLAIMSLVTNLPQHVIASAQQPKRSRSLLIHYLTFAEYDMEVCRDDFEMAIVRNEIKTSITNLCTMDQQQTHIVVVTRFRCGHIAVGIAPFVPEYRVCQKLGNDYYSSSSQNNNALQLNIDDI